MTDSAAQATAQWYQTPWVLHTIAQFELFFEIWALIICVGRLLFCQRGVINIGGVQETGRVERDLSN